MTEKFGDLRDWPGMEGLPAAKVPREHYSTDPSQALFFYGGPFSNFVSPGGRDVFVTADHAWTIRLPGSAPVTEVITYGARYRTVEHFFQASKAQSYEAHELVRRAPTADEAKHLGRSTWMRVDWDEVKYTYMLIGLRAKFEDERLRAYLLGTGERLIAEDSPTDDVWGIRDERGGYTGQNLLGQALMEVRAELRGERLE
jgi:ribA/ribD-fused uncharacterized protein